MSNTCKHNREHTGKNPCPQCLEMGEIEAVNMKPWEHISDFFKDFFYFRFHHCVVDIFWFFQKLTNTGDFGPKGYFTKMGYWKDGKPTRRNER